MVTDDDFEVVELGRGKSRVVIVSCARCGRRLVVALDDDEALALARTNRAARPCCAGIDAGTI